MRTGEPGLLRSALPGVGGGEVWQAPRGAACSRAGRNGLLG